MALTLEYSQPRVTGRVIAIRVCHAAAIAYPCLLLFAFYGAWLLAWVTLGHRPRPSVDDPKEVLGWAYVASAFILPTLPAGALIAVGSITVRFALARSRVMAAVWAVSVVGIWVVVICTLRLDPLRVVNWWFD